MKRQIALASLMAVAMLGFGRTAGAHECTYDGAAMESGKKIECHETPVMPNWRDGNYIPLFDLGDRNDEQQRYDAQRWREQCQRWGADGSYQSSQQCMWLESGTSLFPNRGGGERSPNEVHAGVGANHCFLFEAQHQCEDHDARRGEGVHDTHGGAIYVDACATANSESKYCRNGLKDTQAGVTIMDHNPCGTIVPIVACTDEYHVVRPFDSAYTEDQMNDSEEYVGRILADPELYLCGYEHRRAGNPVCPGDGDGHGHSHLPTVVSRNSDAAAKAVRDAQRASAVRQPARGGRWVAAGAVHGGILPAGGQTTGARSGASGPSWVLIGAALALLAVRARPLLLPR